MIQCRQEVLHSIHQLKKIRQEIHMHPEIGFQTKKTWSYVQQNVPLLSHSIVENGGIFILKGEGKTIGIRCELDALHLQEQGQIPYRSKNKYMHACGHDGHIAMLITLIHYYIKQKHHPTLIFIFQPAEESGAGAKRMIENGLFEKYPMDALLGYHLYPNIPSSVIGCCANELMAASLEWKCQVKGKSGHAALHHGIDSIKAMIYFLSLVYALESKMELIHIGKIKGGEICNGIAANCQVHGTMRSFNTCESIKMQLLAFAQQTDEQFYTQTSFSWSEGYETVKNNDDLVSLLQDCCEDDYMSMDPLFLSEDFSFYTQHVPCCFFFVGIDAPCDLHEDCFDFNEVDCLKGIEICIRMIEKIQLNT